MRRRKFLTMESASIIVGMSGCIDEIQSSDPEESDEKETDDTVETDDDETDTNEDRPPEGYSREAICPDPPDDITEVEYERWTTNGHTTGTSPPLLEDGYHVKQRQDRDPPESEDERLSIITEETRDRLNPERLEAEHSGSLTGPANTDDPTFIEETDFETSVLIAFEWEFSGYEELATEAIGLEDEETVHLYGCRYGDPWGSVGGAIVPPGDPQYAATLEEPSAGPVITFFRLQHIPVTAKFTFSFREYHREKETKTYVTEVEELDSS